MTQDDRTDLRRPPTVGLAAVGLALCFVLGVAGCFITAELSQAVTFSPIGVAFALTGLALAVVLPILPVRMARRQNMGASALLSYCAGFESFALWIGRPLVFPSSSVTYGNRGAAITFVALLMALGLAMALTAFLPAVSGPRR